MPRRMLILGVIEDGVSNLLWYDRKHDEDLPHGEIERALSLGEITIEEMVREFERVLRLELGKSSKGQGKPPGSS